MKVSKFYIAVSGQHGMVDKHIMIYSTAILGVGEMVLAATEPWIQDLEPKE